MLSSRIRLSGLSLRNTSFELESAHRVAVLAPPASTSEINLLRLTGASQFSCVPCPHQRHTVAKELVRYS
jgi:hypothetical protein